MSAIKPVFALFYEATMIFALGFPVPWLRMKLQPRVLLFAPVLWELLRNRISEPEGHKVRRLRLLGMRQVTLSLNYFAIRIESAEGDGESWKLARRNRLEACVTVARRGCRRLRAQLRHRI